MMSARTAAVLLLAAGFIQGEEGAGWKTWSPRPEIAPDFHAAGEELSIRAASFAHYGEWFRVVKGIEAGSYYRFEVLHRAEGVRDEGVSVAAILSWCRDDCTSAPLQRDYVDGRAADGEWQRSFRTVRAPAGAVAAKIELVLRWTEAGSVRFKSANLTPSEPPVPRLARVATTHLVPAIPSTIETNLKLMGDLLDKAGAERADLVCLSENVAGRGIDLPLLERARKVSAATMELLSEKARRHRMYVLTTVELPEDGVVYNTALLYDRQGRLAAKYRKVHLPLFEAELGYTPGSEYAVVDTDFGRLGLLICWDLWFPETARLARLKGAEILVWPLAGDSDDHWEVIPRARAVDNGVYVVSSSTVGRGASQIIDPTGKILAEAAGQSSLAITTLDLNRQFRTPWLSVGPGLGEARSLYLKERRTDTYAPLAGPR